MTVQPHELTQAIRAFAADPNRAPASAGNSGLGTGWPERPNGHHPGLKAGHSRTPATDAGMGVVQAAEPSGSCRPIEWTFSMQPADSGGQGGPGRGKGHGMGRRLRLTLMLLALAAVTGLNWFGPWILFRIGS